MYEWLKWFHVLGMVIYVGGYLTLTRLLGHAVRFESVDARAAAYRLLKRMHRFVDWGGLAMMLIGGLWLVVLDPDGKAYMKQAYFHVKLTFVLILIVSDVMLSRRLFALKAEGEQPKATYFRIMHGVAGLMLIGTLIAVFVLRGPVS